MEEPERARKAGDHKIREVAPGGPKNAEMSERTVDSKTADRLNQEAVDSTTLPDLQDMLFARRDALSSASLK